MSRIIYPDNFEMQTRLFANVKEEHDADGPTSVLNPFLAEKGIDLSADYTAGMTAITAHQKQGVDSRKAEELKRERDLLFEPVWDQHKTMVQFLKSFYKPNVNRLGEWGVTVTNNSRIDYPPNFNERMDSVEAFVAKYGSIPPAANPLTVFLTNNPQITIPTVAALDNIRNKHEAFEAAERDAEEATAERNGIWQPVWNNVRAIGDFLKSLFPNNPKKLGRYGFVVDDSPRAPKYRTSTVKLGQQVTIQGVIIGGTLINTGTVAINVYKGRTATGEFVSVLPNQTFGIEKGFSNITVVNPSTTTSAKFKVLCTA